MDRKSARYQGWFRAASLSLAAAALLLATALSASAASGAAHAVPSTASPKAVPGELVVGFREGATRTEERRAVDEADAAIERRIGFIDGAVVTARPGSSSAKLTSELRHDPAVEFVEPNYVVHAARLPNDPELGQLWGLRNTGELGGKAAADVNASGAWDLTTGGAVTVAVVDTGIDYDHPDLAGNAWTNAAESKNGRDDDGNGFVDDLRGADFMNGDSDPRDDAGHGTHAAGIIGAKGNNGLGTVGVNWNVRLMALKFLDANGEGNTADAAQAIDYAVAGGAKVINASWGGPASSQTLYEAVKQAGDQGVLFVAAAGNEGENADSSPDYPAAFNLPNVISVAATDRSDRLAGFSNYGSQSVDLGAPGDDIYSTVPTSIEHSGYASYSGTSMAAPFVSGAAALYLARSSASSAAQVRDALLQSVDPASSLAGRTVSGGRLNVGKALGIARPARATTPDRDSTAPSRFLLLRPRNRYASRKRGLRFRWQHATDGGGISSYKLYVDGRRVKTVSDQDGPGGRDPGTSAKLKLPSGRHRWFVRAYDYAGNKRRSKVSRRAGRSSRLLYVGKRR